MAEATAKRLLQIQNHLTSLPRSQRLAGKVAIITGAGSPKGIGKASAVAFAHAGVKALYLLDFDATHLPKTKEEIKDKYPDVVVEIIQGDASDEKKTIQGLCQRAVKEQGRLDIMFANAAIVGGQLVQNLNEEDLMRNLKVNVVSVFLATKYAAEAMQVLGSGKESSSGSIILTASVAGIRSGAGGYEYSAAKSAVINMAQTGANHLTGTNIRVNAICPGLIETGMTELLFTASRSRGTIGKVGQLNPLRRYGIAEEIAGAVLFLASDESSYVNGIHLPVDGGLSSSLPTAPGKHY
ncbi:NAD(P)-binding protein [Atractiella rhizophila]|nr:NAD(P)-binding protein [Atractiella rhizophila]